MLRFSKFIRLNRLKNSIFNYVSSNSFHIVHPGIREMVHKYERCIWFVRSWPVIYGSHFTAVNLADDDEDQGEIGEVHVELGPPIQEACHNSINATINFLNVTLDAISSSAFQYKNALNELLFCLERYSETKGFTDSLEKLVDAVVDARAKVFDLEKKYLEMITLAESVEKLTKAVTELSFLMREEDLPLTITNIFHSVRTNIEQNSLDISNIKRQIYEFEKDILSNAGSSILEKEINGGKFSS